jgi:hypothetical protein
MCATLNADIRAGVVNNCGRGFIVRNAFRNCAGVQRQDMRFSWSAGRADSNGEFPESGLEGLSGKK